MSDNCICIEVEESPEVGSVKLRRARVDHQCGECPNVIKPGFLYEYATGLNDGRWWSAKTCARCLNIRSEYFNCGWYYGMLREHFSEVHDFDYVDGIPADFTPCGGAQ